jgi:hypothetical protein
MSEFTFLSREYKSTLEQDYILEQEKTIPRTSSFTAYDALYSKMTASVKGKFKTFKRAKKDKIETDEEVEIEGALDWEEDTISGDISEEELIDFRSDLEYLTLPQAATSAVVDLNLNAFASVALLETEELIVTPSPQELNDRFHQELNKASILADFHERYILASLERRRNSEVGNQDKTENATRAWRESIDANPLIALEDISRTMLARGISHSGEKIGGHRPQPVLYELDTDEEVHTLSDQSKSFSSFIPGIAPRLAIDEKMIEMAEG